MVYLVGHIPPGSNERQRGAYPPSHISYSDHHNKRYLKIVRRYASIIVGQFFGHLHSDTFRVIYGENGLTVGRLLGALFQYDHEFLDATAVSFHNQRYYVIFRHYRNGFGADSKKARLKELGPRFTLRLKSLQKGRPISWALLAPSVTPKRNNDGPNNPGLRLYKFDKDTGQVSYLLKLRLRPTRLFWLK
nr:unnamed protein product [Callosobruchus analis]